MNIFPKLIESLVSHKFATTELMDVRGARKIRVRFEVSWSDLLKASEGKYKDQRYEELFKAVRNVID